MGDSQRIRFHNGQKEMVLTRGEFEQYVSNLSDSAKRRLTFPDGKTYDSVYTNNDGELVRERISGDQIVRRMQHTGESPMITGAQDPKLQAQRQQQQVRAKRDTAADHGILAATAGIAPAQWAASKVLDEDVVDQGFGELKAANPLEYMAGTFALGLGAGGAAMKGLKALGVAGKSARGLAAHVAVDEAAFETALYTKHILDTRQDFQAEELMQNIVQGMVFAAPIVGGALLRKPLWQAAGAAAGAGGNVIGKGLGHARNYAVVKGLRATDQGVAAGYRRKAAILGVGERLFRGRKSVTKADELADIRRTMDIEEAAIGRATPEGLRNAKGGKAEEILDHVRRNMDEGATYLDDIDVNGMARNLGGVRTATRKAGKTVYRVGRTMKVGAPAGIGRIGKTAQSKLEAAMDNFLGYADDMGFGDELGHLRDVAGSGEYGRLFQARLDMAIKGKVGNRATQDMDAALKRITEDADIWGTGNAPEQARNLNAAIDKFAEGYEKLRALDIPDDLSKIPAGTDLNKLDDAIADLREGLDRMHASKLLDPKTRTNIASSLDEVEDALIDGKRAYVDAVKLNKARTSAAKNHKARYDKVKSGDVETVGALEARMEARIAETSKRMVQLKGYLKSLVENNKIPVFTNRVARMLRESDMYERTEFFLHMQEELSKYTGNPEYMAKEMEPFLSDAPSNPQVHAMAGVAAGNAIYFLANKLGRVDRTLYGKRRQPNRDKVNRFFESFVAMTDPVGVAYAAAAGTVTQDMVDAVRVSNPAMYTELSILLSEAIAEADPITFPRKSLAGINKFIGGVDPLYSGEVIMQLQSNYAQNQEQHQAIHGTGGGAPQGQFNQAHPQDGDNAFTFTQRLMSY